GGAGVGAVVEVAPDRAGGDECVGDRRGGQKAGAVRGARRGTHRRARSAAHWGAWPSLSLRPTDVTSIRNARRDERFSRRHYCLNVRRMGSPDRYAPAARDTGGAKG